MVPVTELSDDECLRAKPSIKDMTRSEILEWKKTAKINRNEIYAINQISIPTVRSSHNSKQDDYTKQPISPASQTDARMPVTTRDTI